MRKIPPLPLSVLAITLLASVSVSFAEDNRFLLMTGKGEYGWSINRPSKIDGEAEGRVLALQAVNSQVETMANISKFDSFTNGQVASGISSNYQSLGPLSSFSVSYTKEESKQEAFSANRRGLVVTIEERGFKPGSFSNSSDYNKLTGVRKSKANGILLYTFNVYAPEGYNPQNGNGGGNNDAIRSTFVTRGSRFERTGGNGWVEQRVDGTSARFVERSHSAEFVEMYDGSRDMLVRLYRDRGEFFNRDTRVWAPWTDSNGSWEAPVAGRRFGVTLEPMTLSDGSIVLKIVGVDPNSPASRISTPVGTIISEVNGRRVSTREDFGAVLSSSSGPIFLKFAFPDGQGWKNSSAIIID